ncbi:MAG: hypothetical protein C0393_00120 [Anaerolinea sp.]|nr:hypothetical protein [Anaerolinea sp.]
MSGHKRATITIREDEYRKLQEAEMKLRAEQKDRADQELKMYTNEIFTSAFAEMEQRQHYYEQVISSLDSDLGNLERETAQTLFTQQADFYHEIEERMNDTWENTAQIVDEVSQCFQNLLEMEHRHHQSQLCALNQQLVHQQENQEQKYMLAETWINCAYTLREFIEDQYDFNRFMPGQTEKFDNELMLACENLQQDMPEAAFVSAQQVYLRLSELRLEIEKVMSEWQILYHSTYRTARKLSNLAKKNREIPAIDLNGNEMPFSIDLKKWSGEKYLTLIQQINGIHSILRNNAQRLTIQDLRNYLQEVLPQLENELDDLIFQARWEVINSQIRVNIADLALQALEKQGFVLNQGGYVNNDMRETFFASMRNIEGSEVFIYVDPGRENTNALVIDSKDKLPRTEHELRKRFQEISQTLLQYGLQVGPMEVGSTPKTVATEKTIVKHTENKPQILYLDKNNDRTR